MSIEDRTLLGVGTLVARYRREEQRCTVTRAGDGTLSFVLNDGRAFRSPSAAGSAVMGGIACNGWRFWTPAYPEGVSSLSSATLTIPEADSVDSSDAPAPREETAAVRGSSAAGRSGQSSSLPQPARVAKTLRRVPNQRGLPEGEARWFCAACMNGFLAPYGATPTACPAGHTNPA